MRDVQDLAVACRNEIVAQGRAAANMSQPANDKDTIENSIRDAQLRVEKIVDDYNRKIEDCLSESMSNIGDEIDVYNDTDFVKQVNIKINNRIKLEQQVAGNKAVGGALIGLGGLIAKFANPAAVAIFAGQGVKIGAGLLLKGELGPLAGLIAQPLGNFVQKILTPPPTFWQKMGAMFARNAGNIGKAFGAAGAAVAIAMEVRDANKADENERKLQEQRENTIQNFDNIADEIFKSINDNIKKWTVANIDKIISECDDAIQSLNIGKEQSKLINTKLSQLLKRTENLIEKIQTTN